MVSAHIVNDTHNSLEKSTCISAFQARNTVSTSNPACGPLKNALFPEPRTGFRGLGSRVEPSHVEDKTKLRGPWKGLGFRVKGLRFKV